MKLPNFYRTISKKKNLKIRRFQDFFYHFVDVIKYQDLSSFLKYHRSTNPVYFTNTFVY